LSERASKACLPGAAQLDADAVAILKNSRSPISGAKRTSVKLRLSSDYCGAGFEGQPGRVLNTAAMVIVQIEVAQVRNNREWWTLSDSKLE
jgi:hypothetical protein